MGASCCLNYYYMKVVDGAVSSGLVEVILLTGLDSQLVYRAGEALPRPLQPGDLVRVPLLNRTELGVVARHGTDQDVDASKIKNVLELVRDQAVLSNDLLKLAKWMHPYYAASMESILETMIPVAVRRGTKSKIKKFLRSVGPVEDAILEEMQKRAPKQAKLLQFLRDQIAPAPKVALLKRLGVQPSSCSALVDRGLVEETSARENRVAYEDEFSDGASVEESLELVLTEEQSLAVDSLRASEKEDKFAVHLLHGVTGSGKTEVYLRLMESVLKKGGGVLFLVPEVSLAPQTVDRIRARFNKLGVETAVWHSHLSEGERLDAWQMVAEGRARVVVGARSAVFAPVKKLKLVLVDEEHEPAFKQEETPRYHGRDVAVYRAMLAKCLCVLGSATPSVESVNNVKQGKYILNRLTKRVDDRELPVVHVVDMRREILKKNRMVAFSEVLKEKLLLRYEQKEQSILFINRRGYSKSMLCPECGFVAYCDHCSVTMTYHRTDGQLRCHLCGFEKVAPTRCPTCNSVKVRWQGVGTQRVEEALLHLLPKARIVRMDADVMGRKNLYRKILGDFRRGQIDVLVGTQMIAKGLDFPNVTLVGIVEADLSMHIQDFRAGERTFQLMVQVAGRAGRGDRAGEVVVQTFDPSSAPIQYARRSEFDGFLEDELEQRSELGYPPFRSLIRQVFMGLNPEKVTFYAEHWVKKVKATLDDTVEIRGPVPAPLEKIKDQYRFHVWFFFPRGKLLASRLFELRKDFAMDKDVRDFIDVDPVSLS